MGPTGLVNAAIEAHTGLILAQRGAEREAKQGPIRMQLWEAHPGEGPTFSREQRLRSEVEQARVTAHALWHKGAGKKNVKSQWQDNTAMNAQESTTQ